ncbi:zinc finger protein 831 [Sigmodon hispidus]
MAVSQEEAIIYLVPAGSVIITGVGSTLVSTGRVKNAGKYLCPHCGRDCLKPSVLEKHIRSHTGERPFPCTTCGIAFKTQSNLYKHRRTQTHLNNSRLSLESEGSGTSLLEEGDRPGETASVDSQRDKGMPERTLSPGAHHILVKNRGKFAEATPSLGLTLSHREAPMDQTQMVSPEFPLASPQPRRKLTEPKPSSLQRQQETCLEKSWDSKALEGPLRKCESTDSGYLSRSDSVEQPPIASSPLHSLSEHSAESEGEGGLGCGSAGNRVEQETPGSSLELEKKKLEERIAQLISHNQAVVDDPQLDHVRPRKTVLSKQGSIDLPMPYTYKDSFHFDIRALEPSRRRAALSPARSTFTPLEKARPLFFHSVPTQLSTTMECVPVTRSNSLPFIEGSKLWPEPRDPQDAFPRIQKALSPSLTPARLGDRPGLTLAGIPSGHPRALVRQVAVEDLPCTPTGDPSAIAEDLEGKRAVVKEGVVCKGRANKKYSQKKQKMFSQEKWQVYGNETFKRIYQKKKTNHQGGQKHEAVKEGQRSELDPPPQENVLQTEDTDQSQDSRTAVLGDAIAGAKPGSWGSQPSLEDSLESEFPKQLKAVARAKSPPTLGSTDAPPRGKLDQGCQLPPEPVPLQGRELEASEMALSDPSCEDIKVTCPENQTVLRQPSNGSVGPQLSQDKLPLERKRLKVEGLNQQELPGPLEAEASGGSMWADSQTPQKQNSNSEEVLGISKESFQHVTMTLKFSDAPSAVSAVALRWSELGNKDLTLPSIPRTPGHHSLLPAQLRDPGIPAAVSGGSFAPKYLLRLPQGENLSPHVAPGPGKGPDSECTGSQSMEQALLAGSELGMLQPPEAYSGPDELPCTSVSGTRVQDQVSSPQRKKGLCRRRLKTSHDNRKQKKLRPHFKRHEGSFWQRAKRLCKPPWLPRRSCLPHQLEGLELRGTLGMASSEAAGLNLRGEPSCGSTDLPVGQWDKDKEDDCQKPSESILPSTSSKTIFERDNSTLKDVSPSAHEHNDCSQEEKHANGSGLSLQSNVYLAVFQEDPLPQGKGFDVGPPGTLLLPSQDQVSKVSNLCISPDISEPLLSFRSKETFSHRDIATSVAGICFSAGTRTGHKTREVHSPESYAEETPAQNSPDRRAIPESISQVFLPGRPSPGKISPGETHLEIPTSGSSSTGSHQEEVRPQADFPSSGQYGYGEDASQSAALGSKSKTCHTKELITPKSIMAPSDQGQPSEISEASLRSIQKRTLGGMRKQTRVELSDTSSDDEDRLVIECCLLKLDSDEGLASQQHSATIVLSVKDK